MKITKFLLSGLLIIGFYSNYAPKIALSAPAKTKLVLTKTVTVSIEPGDGIMKGSVSLSFPVGQNAKPTTTVYWNKWGFIVKDDAGKEIGGLSDDVAFGKKQTARFVLRKKVSIKRSDGSILTATSSKTVTVRRGVVATF